MAQIGKKVPTGSDVRQHQLVDWSSAIWAGIAAGAVFLIVNLFVMPAIFGGNAWVYLRIVASIVMGHDVLAPPATFDAGVLAVSISLHFALSIGFGILVSIVVYRGGLAGGILIGGLIGGVLYAINVYSLKFALPWLYTYMHTSWFVGTSGWMVLAGHILFGATAGGVYESLEVEEWEAVDAHPQPGRPGTPSKEPAHE
jgi:hypothetical protein